MEIEIFAESRLRYWTRRLGFPQPAVEGLAEISRLVQADPELYTIFCAVHQKTALQGEWYQDFPLPADPLVESRLGERASLFYLLAHLAALPYTAQEYHRLDISDRIFDDTMSDIRIWFLHEYDLYNVWKFKQFHWIWLHLDCQLFRLGRLQYVLCPFHGQVTAYRHKTNGEVLLLADPSLPLRPDGFASGAGKGEGEPEPDPTPGAWNAVFEAKPDGWRGNPVSPYGYALKQPVFLSKEDWELVLQKGDTVLDIHIPRKDPLTEEACRASLRQAYEFFPRRWPDRPFKASICHTWFFTPQLQQLLPPESNIVRFQREFYLYPFAGELGFLWFFVFGARYPDRATAPRDTRLRKAVLEWLDRGGEIFDLPGVRFHGPDEWGSQPYMRAWDQHVASCHSERPQGAKNS